MEIKLVQKPIIEHQLVLVGESIEKRLKELNLDNLVATVETVKSLKDTRAELNKEHSILKDQLKEVLSPITDPVAEIKELFKENVTEKYKPADDLLKDKVSAVEMKVKDEKQEKIESYFQELCASEEIDFLKFSNVGLNINLSTSEKKYKEQCNEFVTKVKDDLLLIESEEFKTEILVEYKEVLVASTAITCVRQRKENERIEKVKEKQVEQDKRRSVLLGIAVTYKQATKVYSFNDEIYVSEDKVEKATKEDFESILIRLSAQIKAFNKEKEAEIKSKEIKPQAQVENKQPIQQKIKAPVEEKPQPEILTTSFEVSGTLPQLKALAAYMRENNITFKSIKDE